MMDTTPTPNSFDHAIGDNINELLDALRDVRPGVWVDRQSYSTRNVPIECVRLLEAQIASELLGRRSMLLELDKVIPSDSERSMLNDILASCSPGEPDQNAADHPSPLSTERGREDAEGMMNRCVPAATSREPSQGGNEASIVGIHSQR